MDRIAYEYADQAKKAVEDLDSRSLDAGELYNDGVVSGSTVQPSGTLDTTILVGTCVINGIKYYFDQLNISVTATSDNYIDMVNDGTASILVTAIDAGEPGVTTNAIRLAKVVTDGTSITSIVSLATPSLNVAKIPTDLTVLHSTTEVTIESSDGNDTSIAAASTSQAGVMSKESFDTLTTAASEASAAAVATTTTASLLLKSDKTNVLERDNTDVYSPASQYEPATKGYVDAVALTGGGNVEITKKYRHVATNLQTVFNADYIVGSLDVYLNGVQLDTSDYVAGNGTSITLSIGAATSDIVTVVSYGGADVYNKTQSDALLNAKADLSSPTLTGVPHTTTAAVGTNTTQIASTQYVITNTEDSLTSTSTTKALSAGQGKILNDSLVTKVGSAQEAGVGTLLFNVIQVTQVEYDNLTRSSNTLYAIVG